MDNIVRFPGAQRRRPANSRSNVLVPEPGWMRERRYAKNPLRKKITFLSIAIVEANKLPQFVDSDGGRYIREGIAVARSLADDLQGIADSLGIAS